MAFRTLKFFHANFIIYETHFHRYIAMLLDLRKPGLVKYFIFREIPL